VTLLSGVVVQEEETSSRFDTFAGFFREAEPRLRRALVSHHGHDDGREATAEALAWAYEHWEEVRTMDNPIGYLYRVGSSRARPRRRRRPVFDIPVTSDVYVEPALATALARLPASQRVAVVLTTAFDWKLREVAELMGVSISTVSTHLDRGLRSLRRSLGVEDHG
jgi:DNA-directed RNA polymerase specialized sigma24 family protein